MQIDIEKLDEPTTRLIDETVREFMTPFGCTGVRTRVDLDHGGDPSIFIEVDYDLSENPIESEVTQALSMALWDKLWQLGDRRFPYIRHRFHDRQKIWVKRRGGRRVAV